MGAYCHFCGRRCFVVRVIPDGPSAGWTGCLATCQGGMAHDLKETGHTHLTAINPVTDPEAAAAIPWRERLGPEPAVEAHAPGASYHPDREINAQVAADALDAEHADLDAGYPPRPWACPSCGTVHSRGHFGAVGVHRCLACGYVGTGGVLLDDDYAAVRRYVEG